MTRKHRLQDLTWSEFRDRIAEEDPVVIIPLGSQEEQGPMAPMGDFMLTEILAGRIAEQSGAIVAPIMPFGYADYFRTVPGGIALRPDTFAKVLEDILENFLDHGLNRLVVFNGHSGNFPLIDQTIRKVKQQRGVLVPCLNVWRLLPSEKWEEIYGDDLPRAAGHGAEPLTSVALHLVPDLMRMEQAKPGGPFGEMLGLPTSGLNSVKFQGIDVNLAVDVTDHCADGITGGDPTIATAERGAQVADFIVSFTVAFIDHMKTADPTAAST